MSIYDVTDQPIADLTRAERRAVRRIIADGCAHVNDHRGDDTGISRRVANQLLAAGIVEWRLSPTRVVLSPYVRITERGREVVR